MKYKFNKRNVILNALFRLININESFTQFYYIKLDTLYDVYIYTITLIEINKDFKIRIIKDYRVNTL